MTNQYQHLAVCTTCFGLSGIEEGREHRCGCQPKDDEWRGREWAGHDIAAVIDLCHLCVRSPVISGSRWSWYACEECRSVDNTVANAIVGGSDPRHRILPLGRHSLMNGTVLRTDRAQHDIATKRFLESLLEMRQFWSRLWEWKKEEAQRLAEVSGLKRLASVPLETWLEANDTTRGASVDAWCRFVGDGLPDVPGLDDLRQARYRHMDRRAT